MKIKNVLDCDQKKQCEKELSWKQTIDRNGTYILSCNDDIILIIYNDCQPYLFLGDLEKLVGKTCVVGGSNQ